MRRRSASLLVACPRCKAGTDDVCLTERGTVLPALHEERHIAAEDETNRLWVLFSAAEELLEVCKAVLASADDDDATYPPCLPNWTEVVKKLRVVIAKAEGET